MPPDFLVVGNIVKDISPSGWRLGGTAAYGALQAARLGRSVVAVTSCAPDISPPEIVPAVRWHVLPSFTTTTFENAYTGGLRQQRVAEVGSHIGSGQLPASWLKAPVAFLGPVLGELDDDLGTFFCPETLVGLGAQGWLRSLDAGRVLPGRVTGSESWLVGDIVFVSEEDVDEPDSVARWRPHIPTVVLTRGQRGCTVWDEAGRHEVPALPTTEVDPTGAGDCFAAAFLVRRDETADNLEAARFASAAAALVVRGTGLEAVADRRQIDALLTGAEARAS